jgi:hypothetical protein
VRYHCLTLYDSCIFIGQDLVDSLDPVAVFCVDLMCFLVEDTQEYTRPIVLLYIVLQVKAIPLQAWTGPEGSNSLSLPDWFPWAQEQMQRWFPPFQVASTCFSCSPPNLNSVVPVVFYHTM